MYGKLIRGELQTAPKKLEINGNWVWNAPSEAYLSQGWKPIHYTEPQEAPSGYCYVSSWEEKENEILQVWTLEEAEMDDSEFLKIILGME